MEDEENSTSPFVEDDISEQFREDPADDEMAHDLEEYPGAAAIVDLCEDLFEPLEQPVDPSVDQPVTVTVYTEASGLPCRTKNRKAIKAKPNRQRSAYTECPDCLCGFIDINQLQKHLLSHSDGGQEHQYSDSETMSLLPESDELNQRAEQRKSCGNLSEEHFLPGSSTEGGTPMDFETQSAPLKKKIDTQYTATMEKKHLPTGGQTKLTIPSASIPSMGSVPVPPGGKIVSVLTLTPAMLKKLAPSLIPDKGTMKITFSTKGLPLNLLKMAGQNLNSSTQVPQPAPNQSISTVGQGEGNVTPQHKFMIQNHKVSPIAQQPDPVRNIIQQKVNDKLESLRVAAAHKAVMNAQKEAANTLINDVTICQLCKSVFRTVDSYVNHLAGFHKRMVNEGIRCEVCAQKFTDPAALVRHIQPCCPNDPKYACRKCDITFDNIDQLRDHMVIHTSKYEWQCIFCKENFKSIKELATHKVEMHLDEGEEARKVSVEKEFLARGVGKSKKEVKGTKARYEGQFHLCEICGYSTIYPNALRYHMKRHNGIKDFVCEYCDKAFYTSAMRTSHRRTHTGEKPFACPQCPKLFATSSSLRLHLRFHNDVRPHACDLCEKAFHTAQNMRVHRERHFPTIKDSSEGSAPKKKRSRKKQKKGGVEDD